MAVQDDVDAVLREALFLEEGDSLRLQPCKSPVWDTALTLRSLFVHQPEMIDATYAESLVPTRQRLLHSVEGLEGMIETSNDREYYSMLLAYVGRLLGERAIIERGLARMAIEAPDDPMVPLLKSLWLDGQPAPPRPHR